MSELQVRDEGDPRKYWTQVPNLIDDLKLSVYAFRLYIHLKRVAGDDGKCWQSTRTLAVSCNMSTGVVTKAKKELDDMNLITIDQEKNPKGGKDFHIIKIKDIWGDNAIKYSTSSQDELASSPHERSSSPHEIKNNPIKNKTKKKKLSRKRDVRLDHPAIISFRDEYHRHVPIAWREEVVTTVTDNEKWEEIIHSWNGKGWNPTNVEGMLDVYKNGWNKKKGVDTSAFDQVREEMGE